MVKCDYCGEEEATEKIMDPNLDMSQDIDWYDEKNWWQVCKCCKEIIPLQNMQSIGQMLGNENLISHANKKIEELANKYKKPVLNAGISKNEDGTYETASIEFTGEGECGGDEDGKSNRKNI